MARLIAGGLQTKIYMVNTGGFDTHANKQKQTPLPAHMQNYYNVYPGPSALLWTICNGLQVQDKVMGMTFSEFGRRIKSNASGGTDHGAAAPVFYFGHTIKPGIIGSNPIIPANATVNDNVPMQTDFRSIYATVLKTWLGLQDAGVQLVLGGQYAPLPIIG